MKSSRRFFLVALMSLLTLPGCASGGGGGGTGGGNANLITQAELTEAGDISVFQAIERLRPNWLRSRASEPPVLFMDGMRQTDIEMLRSMRAADVQEIRFRSASDATTRYGTGFTGGAIEVTTRRR